MRKVAVIAVLCILAMGVKGQYRFGVSVDPQIGWMSTDLKKVEGDNPVTGISFGLNIDRYFARNYGVYSGVFIESTGGELKYADGIRLNSKDNPIFDVAQNGTVKYRLQYLTIPTGIKLRTNPIGYNSFFAMLGFKTSLNLKTKGFTNDGLSSNSGKQTVMDGEVLENSTNGVSLGYQLGVGTEYALGGNISLVLGLIYNNGLTSTLYNSKAHVNQNNVTFKIGVMF